MAAAPLAAEAQQAGKVYRIGYLSTPTRESVEHGLQAFLRKLRELGWVEGHNLIIEYRIPPIPQLQRTVPDRPERYYEGLFVLCPLELKRELDELDLTEGERNECDWNSP